MSGVEDLVSVLNSIDSPGWGPSEVIRAAAVFGAQSMDGVVRKHLSDERIIGCWYEDSDTLWLSYEDDQSGAGAEFRASDISDGRLRAVLVALMSADFVLRPGVNRHSTMTVSPPGYPRMRFDVVRDNGHSGTRTFPSADA